MNITVKSGEQFFITSEDSYDSAVVLSNGLLTVEAGGYVSGTVIVQSGGVLRLEEDSQVVGKLIAGGRVESEDGIVTCQHFYGFYPRLLNMTFLLDERTPEDIAIIDCLDNFQREATDRYTTTVNYSIHVTDGLAEGTYALAENAWDLESAASDSDIVCEISINGEVGDWGSPSLNVTVNGDSGVDGVFGNQYTLFIDDEGTLKLTITATGEIDQECGGKYAEILSNGAVVSRAGILRGKAVSQNGNDTLHVHSQGSAIQTTIGAGGIGMVYSRGVASETVVNGGELQVLEGGYAYETEVLGQGSMTVSGGKAYGGTVSDNGQVNLEPGILSHGDGCVFWAQGQAYDFEVASGGSFTAYDHSLAVNLTIQ
ncbi:MAG: hypothetical protein J6866_00295, partial [Victivallales bacterium]|nr:hypothetical protein [Victivallales bacterium]